MTRMAQTGSSLAALASAMQTLPQVLINVDVADKATAAAAPAVQAAVEQAGPNWVIPVESCCVPRELNR